MPPLSPPPRRSDWVKNRNEEGQIKEMVVVEGDSSTINESIPVSDDLLFEILQRLPAKDIYFGARLVCRKWYHMVRTNNFVHKHLERESYGLLYTDVSTKDLVFISSREDGGIDKINCQSNFDYVPMWFSTWNGLILEYQKTLGELACYNVRNVLTCQNFRLPSLPYSTPDIKLCGIGYDAASMRYKVVLSFKRLEYECVILTVGVDKSWRTVCTDHLSLGGKNALLCTPIITEGFVHWSGFCYSYDVVRKRFCHSHDVVTLNLDTETIAETPSPIPEVEASTQSRCFSTGRYLSLFIRRGKLLWEALVMKPETGEWRMLANISLEGKKGKLRRVGLNHYDYDIEPCGWLKYPEVLAMRVQRCSIIFFNLITCEIGPEILSTALYDPSVLLLKTSLVSF